MSPWSTRHYASIKESILLDIENLSKRLEIAKQELAEADSVEESCEIRERIRKLEGYLKTSETSLKRFEFRHTHDGRDPEEFYERKIEERKIEEEVKLKRKPRQTGKEKIDYSKINVINPKTGKRYSNARIRTLYLEGKIKLA